MSSALNSAQAAVALRQAGVIAYPTEGVWGLGCNPFDEAAVLRLLAIKQRAVEKGMILIAGSLTQLDAIVDWSRLSEVRRSVVINSWPGPNTWVVPAQLRVPRWITGSHDSVAVRVTDHPDVIALCAAFDGPLVSTSANFSSLAPARTRDTLDPALLAIIDGVLVGETAGLSRPTMIRDARSGETLRT